MLQRGRFNVVVDGQFGSTGKGKIAAYLARTNRPKFISTTNGPNAGHVAVSGDRQFLSKILPASAIHDAEMGGATTYIIGAGAIFFVDRLLEEIKLTGVPRSRVWIHERAMVVTPEHKAIEQSATKHLASTMQGTAAAVVDKIMRKEGVKLARDYPELSDMIFKDHMASRLFDELKTGAVIMHEGSQGFSLGINHGHSYPTCTSRECSSTQMLADMGLPAKSMGNVILVIRPYPIRVGNVVENGVQLGYSGDVYPDQKEITWAQVASEAGAPEEVTKGELTTVTKRLRRVFTFSMEQLKQAVRVNGVTHIALNFANYIDWKCFGMGGDIDAYNALPTKVKQFVSRIENELGVPVPLIGTGPDEAHLISRDRGEATLTTVGAAEEWKPLIEGDGSV